MYEDQDQAVPLNTQYIEGFQEVKRRYEIPVGVVIDIVHCN